MNTTTAAPTTVYTVAAEYQTGRTETWAITAATLTEAVDKAHHFLGPLATVKGARPGHARTAHRTYLGR